MDGLQLTKAQQQGRVRSMTPVLTSFVTDDGTFADPQFDGGPLLRPAQVPAKGTDARPRGQQHREAGKPPEGWIWKAPTRSSHVESSSLKKQHRRALRL